MIATLGPDAIGQDAAGQDAVIRTPDQRVRVFVSSTLRELSAERQAVREAVNRLRLVPVMFELAARPHPPRELYRAYLQQSQVFVGVYWQSYGWVAPGEEISGLEDEYRLSAGLPRLIYVKSPAPDREPRLTELLARIRDDDSASYQRFSDPAELQRLVEDDLALLLSERFELTRPQNDTAPAVALPVPATPLVDREQETAQLVDLVAGQGVRLITLTGPGGVGKTRLAVAAASRLASEFPDGVRFVDLASVRAPDLVPAAIAAALGLNTSGDHLVSDVTAYLRTKRLLLVLDNFEQVADAAPAVAELLAISPGLVVLVASRTVLRLSGEYEFAVPPLAVPPPGAVRDAGALRGYPSIQLFAARARAEAPGFELTSRNLHAIAEICRRLDGLPLAIELAAARIRLLPPQALLARLDDRMSVLTAGPRDLPERQRTLRNTIDWSFGLLTPDEQALFARLSVFVGSFGLPAATAVCGDPAAANQADQPARVVETLGSLVDSSLVRAEPSEDEPRFVLLDTIREYALERLRESGDWQDAHDRHAAHFLALAQPAETELRGAGQLAWLNRLEIRRRNLNAALSWLIEQNQLEQAVDLVWATWRFWWLHGHIEELTALVDQILARSDRMPSHQRALALSGAGFVRFVGGDQAPALRLLKRSLPLYRESGDRLRAGLTAAALGHLLASSGSQYAGRLLEQTLARLRGMAGEPMTEPERLQYLSDVALAANFLGQIRLDRGDHDRAAELFTDGLSAAHSAADRFTVLISLYDLALSRQAGGDLDDAADLLRQGLSLAAEAGDEPGLAYYLEALAAVVSQQDHPERSAGLLAAAAALLEASGSGWLHAYVPRAPHDDRAIAALRERTTDAAFRRAWARGRSLTAAGAVRYALREEPHDRH
jgi:predicted ATPase